MANTASNVTAGKPKISGAFYRAPVGTVLPTDATSELDAAFKPLGYISEDGVTNANSADTDTVHAWGGDPVLDIQNSKEDTFQFTPIETLNLEVLKMVYGDENVTGDIDSGIVVKANAKEAKAASYVIDMIATGDIPHRIIIPNAKISEVGDIEYTDGDAVGYETTLSAMVDDEGNTHYEYFGGKKTA